MRTRIALIALLGPSLAAASPALVTTTRGEVQLEQNGEASTAPAVPFVFDAPDRLTLADDALVVVLFEGAATQLHGPRTVGLDDLKTRQAAPSEHSGTLDSLLTARITTSRAGASRDGATTAHLTRPVPGSRLTALQSVAWRCDACAAESVSLYDLQRDVDVWAGSGDGSVIYDGPALQPGAYLLALDGREHAITVVSERDRTELTQLVDAATAASDQLVGVGADVAARTSVLAAVYLQAGYPTEALYALDHALAEHPEDAELQALRERYELRAGLAP